MGLCGNSVLSSQNWLYRIYSYCLWSLSFLIWTLQISHIILLYFYLLDICKVQWFQFWSGPPQISEIPSQPVLGNKKWGVRFYNSIELVTVGLKTWNDREHVGLIEVLKFWLLKYTVFSHATEHAYFISGIKVSTTSMLIHVLLVPIFRKSTNKNCFGEFNKSAFSKVSKIESYKKVQSCFCSQKKLGLFL